jgi:hypothetical protein
MTTESDRLKRYYEASWQRFVESIYEMLDNNLPLSTKDIEKKLIENKWGLPKRSDINIALNNDLNGKVQKVGKSKWTKA